MNTLDKYMEDEWNDHVAENMSNMISDYYMHPDSKSAIEEVENDIFVFLLVLSCCCSLFCYFVFV
jgi:hypothetical protein